MRYVSTRHPGKATPRNSENSSFVSKPWKHERRIFRVSWDCLTWVAGRSGTHEIAAPARDVSALVGAIARDPSNSASRHSLAADFAIDRPGADKVSLHRR